MEAVPIYKKQYYIEISNVDFLKKLKLSALFGYFQDIASMHADNLGIGVNTLDQKYGAAWVLMRIRVDIIRNPVLNEEITIETWPQEPGRFFERDFVVRDVDGNIIIRAISTWVIINIKTRELAKSDLISAKIPLTVKGRAIDCKLVKLKTPGQLEIAYKKVVGYSDIDFNGHLNNSRYVDFIMDCFNLEGHRKYGVKTIEVNYTNEALPGDTIILNKDVSTLSSGLLYIEGINEKENKVVFKSQMEIETK